MTWDHHPAVDGYPALATAALSLADAEPPRHRKPTTPTARRDVPWREAPPEAGPAPATPRPYWLWGAGALTAALLVAAVLAWHPPLGAAPANASTSTAPPSPAPATAADSPVPPAILATPATPEVVTAPSAQTPRSDRTTPPNRKRMPNNATAINAADAPIFHRHAPDTEITSLERAHALLQAGRFDEAEQAYRAIVHTDPHNPDALTALGLLAARHGEMERATALYGRALVAAPRHGPALAGLTGIQGTQMANAANAANGESRLRTLLAGDPGNASLHFALGNLLAGQQRWSEAQQSFFAAHAAAPDNPDLAYNLAVALDRLHQPSLAVRYYRLALAAAHGHPAGFDARQVQSRLEALVPAEPEGHP